MLHDQSAIALAAERLEVTDALLRFGAGVDHNDEELLAAVFSDDAVVDFRPCGRAMGLDFPVLTGGDTILRFLRAAAEAQTTTHVITNGWEKSVKVRQGSAPSSMRPTSRKAIIPAAAR